MHEEHADLAGHDATSALLMQLAVLKQAADFNAARLNAALIASPVQTMAARIARLVQQAHFARRQTLAPAACAAHIVEQSRIFAQQAKNDWRTRAIADPVSLAGSALAAKITDQAFMAQVCGQRLYDWRQAQGLVR